MMTDNLKALLQPKDADILLNIVKPIHPRTVLEIGTFQGFSAEMFLNELKPDLFITVELEERDALPRPTVDLTGDGVRFLWGKDSNDSATLEHVRQLLNGKQVDFLFIDGGHEFNVVKRDWELYSPLVRPGGIIGMHDVVEMRPDMQIKPWFDYLKTKYAYIEARGVPNSSGMGLIFV